MLAHKKMAHAHEVQRAMGQHEEMNLFSIIIKRIPLYWDRDRLLQLFIHIRLPAPAALNYLYNEIVGFRGMAFATFASPDQTRQVVRELNYHPVGTGRCLKVEFKKRRTGTKENPYRKNAFEPVLFSHIEAGEEARRSVCGHSSRRTRQQTPPSESYELLMRYQRDPAEKEKLKRFLAQTGDHQEAVNEFAKNRKRETPLRSFVAWMEVRQQNVEQLAERRLRESNQQVTHEDSDDKPILEMRPATEEDLEQIAAMEAQFGVGGQAASWPPLVVKYKGEHVGGQDFGGVASDRLLENIN